MSTDAGTDEDTLVVRPAWSAAAFPRRGEVPVGYTPRPTAVTETAHVIGLHRDTILAELGREGVDGDLADAGRAWLAGDPGRTPLGAAVVAGVLMARLNWRESGWAVSIADGWITEHGVDFAARAYLELAGLYLGRYFSGHLVGPLRRRGPSAVPDTWSSDGTVQVRAAIAAAPEQEYAAVVRTLQEFRGGIVHQRFTATFLDPTRPGWIEEDIAALAAVQWHDAAANTLLTCVTTAAQVDALTAAAGELDLFHTEAIVHTLVRGAGSAALGPLLAWLDHPYANPDMRRTLLPIIAALPTDAAFTALLERIEQKHVPATVMETAGRFPARAVRLLAVHAGRRPVSELLRSHVARHRKLAETLLPALPVDAARRVTAVIDAIDAAREAPAHAVPPILVTPPWTGRRKAAPPVVIEGLTCTDGPSSAWVPGERDLWRGGTTHLSRFWRPGADTGVDADIAWIRRGATAPVTAVRFFLHAPESVAAPMLAEWRIDWLGDGASDWLRLLVARFDAAAYPVVLAVAREAPAEAVKAMMPIAGPELAELVADWFHRVKPLRAHARSWLTRHPAAAARALTPAALGKAGPARQAAGLALAAIGRAGHRDTAVAAAADAHGTRAADAVAALLDADPLTILPARMPTPPDWADPAVLAPVQLRDGGGALPATAVRHLLMMLAVAKPDEPYAGIDVVREACDPASLAEFGWSLFQQWLNADSPSKGAWAFDALSVIGDDETVRRLSPLVRAWPTQNLRARAVTGVEVLARMGSDLALMHLHGIADKVKNRSVRERAAERLADAAAARGLSPEQLADRLVPDLGLDPNGSLTLDYGPRRFVVGFDEQLKPYVADEGGARRKDLPKPGAKDDPVLAPVAAQRFTALKKDVRTIAADQVRRLEQAMVRRRRWTAEELRDLFIAHPLIWHLARRLVWAGYADDGTAHTAFRIAEDRTLATVDDDPATLDPAAVVGIAHPLDLGPDLTRWSGILSDYEILQPFPQLGRDIHTLTPAERAAVTLTRFAGRTGPSGRFIGLDRHDWRLGPPQDGGGQCWVEHDLPGGHLLIAELHPGIFIGDPSVTPQQTVSDVHIIAAGDPQSTRHHIPFGVIDPITASELLRDLHLATA